MAKKSMRKAVPKSKKQLKKTHGHKKPVKKTLKPSPKSSRRKVDPRTGIEISRRQYEKLYGRKKRAPNVVASYRHKFKLYLGVRDDYIEKYNTQHKKKITKSEAMKSDTLKKIVRDLHSKNPIIKAAALARTGRITKDQIELYAQKFANED